jgi:hypothetical protein
MMQAALLRIRADPSGAQRQDGPYLTGGRRYQLIVARVASSGGFENALGKIGLCFRSRIFRWHSRHDLFKSAPHYVDKCRIEGWHVMTPDRVLDGCTEREDVVGPNIAGRGLSANTINVSHRTLRYRSGEDA